MKAKFVKKLMAISLSLAMMATMVPVNVQAGTPTGKTAVSKETESVKKESETQKTSETVKKESETQKASETAAEKESVKTYKTKVILPDVKAKTKVKSLSVKQDGKEYKYDYSGLETTSAGELTLKLPANAKGKTTTVVVNDVTFSGTVTDDDKAELKASASNKSTEKGTEASEKSTEKSTEKTTEKETVKSAEKSDKQDEKQTESDKKEETGKKSKGIADDKLVITPVTFENATYGYTARPAMKTISITNNDDINSTQIKSVTIDGTEFELLPNKASKELAPKEKLDLTIQPNLGLKAGTYKRTITVAYTGLDTSGNETDETKKLEVSFTVKKKALDVSFGVKGGLSSITYNGSKDVNVTAAVTGALGSDQVDLAVKELAGTMADANVGINKPVTVSSTELAKLILTGSDAANYQLGTLAPKVEVTVAPVKVTPIAASVATSKVYDKSREIDGTLTATGILKTDEDKVKLIGTFELAKADAGTYTKVTVKDMKLEGDNASNYELTGDTTLTLTETSDGKKIEVKVKKAEAQKTPKAATISSFTYNSIKVKAVEGYEYAIVKSSDLDDADDDDLIWESTGSTYLTLKKDYEKNSIRSSTKYTVISRIAESKNYEASKKADYEEKDVTTLRNPVTADSSKCSISGITNNGTYKVSNSISFTATGASTGMSSDSLDDVKYVPESWTTTAGFSDSWSGSSMSQSASFTPTKSGTYKLEVKYRKVTYDGKSWIKDQSGVITKSVTFTVNSTGKSGTTSTNSGTGKTTTGVKTGDTSPILPLVIVLVVCIAVFAGVGVLGARKKRRNK